MAPLPVANLTGRVLALGYFGWLDIVGDPVRATTLPGGKTFGASETGDPDLDGDTFVHVPGDFVMVGDVEHGAGGSSPLEVSLSGLAGVDTSLLTALATASNWRGRVGRFWKATVDAGGVTAIAPYYTGYMVDASIGGAPDTGSVVSIKLENYSVLLTRARGRTYLDQTFYDSGDLSPARIRAAANGATASGIPPGQGLPTIAKALAESAAAKLRAK
jgi:hypothetical protein